MTVILMSLGVTTANFKVAELFCRNRFGDSAVDISFERGIVADCATGWMNDNVGHQRLYATEQRVSSAGERPLATRVAAAQEGLDEAMRQALAASSAKEASAVSNAKETVSNVSDILRCDHDDDAGCKQSGRSQVQELRGAMRETSAK